MANCHDLFLDFNEKISLSDVQMNELRDSRDAVRDTIIGYFKKENIKIPDFRQQGSFDIKTIIKPIAKPYDIDYGVYINELPDSDNDINQIRIIKSWIFKSVENQTDAKPSNKKNCIRVFYKNKYNIDLPIYKTENNFIYLATNDSGWQQSNPNEFSDWFFQKLNEKGEQLRKNVKYFKAFVDFNSIKFKSIAITILVAQYYCATDKRDDKSFVDTLEQVIQYLNINKSVTKPVFPYDNVLSDMDFDEINELVTKLENILKIAKECILIDDRILASQRWCKIFGPRFQELKNKSNSSEENNIYIKNSSPKPWKI